METKKETGKYKTRRNYLNFVTGTKTKVRIFKKEAFLKGSKLSLMLEDCKFKFKIYEDGTIDFEEIGTTICDESMIKRLINDIDVMGVTGYVQKYIVSDLTFEDEDGNLCYLEVEQKKPIEKMYEIFDAKKEVSIQGLSILDSLFQDNEVVQVEEKKETPKVREKKQIKNSTKHLEEVFEKMNLEKIKELQERIEQKESEILKNALELERCEEKNLKFKSELKVLNSRLKSLMPKESPNGYNFFVTQENKTGIELDESLKKIATKISPILSLKESALLEILTTGFYTISLQKKDGTDEIERDIINRLLSIDIDGKFEPISKFEFKYRGQMTWHQIVDALICKGFEQDQEFDKKCGSNSYQSI